LQDNFEKTKPMFNGLRKIAPVFSTE